jgi:hypothetical protein
MLKKTHLKLLATLEKRTTLKSIQTNVRKKGLQTYIGQKKLKTKPEQNHNNKRTWSTKKKLIADMLQQQKHIANTKIRTNLKG